MNKREKLKFVVLAGLLAPLSIAANAVGTGDGVTGGSASDSRPTLRDDAPACVDLNAHCSTLMVNYFGDVVEFALFRRDGSQGTGHAAGSMEYSSPNGASHSSENLGSSKALASDANAQSLGVDFLQGFSRKGDDSTSGTALSGGGVTAVGTDDRHNWAAAAATSMDLRLKQASFDDFTVPVVNEDKATFWDFEYVYLWQVEEYILEAGRYDISQVALDDIYLSPKTNTSSDPDIVVCEINDASNCRPLAN